MEKNTNAGLGFAIALLAVAIGVFYYVVNVPQPCHPIDKEFFYCRIDGTFGDWLGAIFWFAGPLAALILTIKNKFGEETYAGSKGGGLVNTLFVGSMAVGAILAWLF